MIKARKGELEAIPLSSTFFAFGTSALILLSIALNIGNQFLGFGIISDLESGVLLFFFLCLIGTFTNDFSSLERIDLSFSRINRERVVSPIFFAIALSFLWYSDFIGVSAVRIACIWSKLPVLLMRFWRYRNMVKWPVNLELGVSSLWLGSKLHISAIIAMVSSQIDRMVISSLWPPAELAFYLVDRKSVV